MANNNAPSMAVTLTQFNTATADFTDHYTLGQCNTSFGGKELQVSWDDFAKEIDAFVTTNNVSPDAVALRFVNCYDPGTSNLYLRLQVLTMVQDANSTTYNLVESPCAWYKISEAGMAPTQDSETYCSDYLDNFYYNYTVPCSQSDVLRLADDKGATFARNFVLPWGLEVAQLYADNNSPQGASLCFGVVAYYNATVDIYQQVSVLFLRTANGTALLSDTKGNSNYNEKGCDFATSCPPICNCYVYMG